VTRRRRAIPVRGEWLVALAVLGCGDGGDADVVSAVERGEALFQRGLTSNELTCATCHRARPRPGDERVLPGADLAGVTRRASYWGGAESDLLRALGYCQTRFMGVEAPLAASDREAGDLYAFLESLEGPEDAVPFTVVRTVADLAPGDATAGRARYERTCAGCHGAMDTGEGALSAALPTLPGDVVRQHSDYTPLEQRLVFVEKVRHGAFLGYDGEMPPFSLEVLPDPDLADVLSALGLDLDAEEP
jgi:thiosulfate dehydrogenase